jgi:ABC-type lipopolysaccharide export system ATPase subunit
MSILGGNEEVLGILITYYEFKDTVHCTDHLFVLTPGNTGGRGPEEEMVNGAEFQHLSHHKN